MASGAAMKTSLMLMLLLGAVVAAHGHPVKCTNTCPAPITLGGVTIGVGLTVTVDIKDVVKLSLKDKLGVVLFAAIKVPADVSALLVVYEAGFVKVKVAAAVTTLLGKLLGLLKCLL